MLCLLLSYPFNLISFSFSVFSVVFVAFIFICTLGIFHGIFLSFKRFIQPLSKKKLKCVFFKAAEPNVFLFFFLHNKNKFIPYVSVLWIGNIFPFLILIYFLFLPYFYILKLKIRGLGIFFWVDNAGMNHSPPTQRLSKSDTAEVSRPFFLAALFLV